MPPIRFGLILPAELRHPEQWPTLVADMHRALDVAAGHFDSAWMVDHLQSGADGLLESFTTLSYMAAVRLGKVERVIIFKLDRLGRSLPHLALILEELQRYAVALIVASQGIDTSNSNPVGRLQLNVLMAVAEFEREIIRERVNAGLAAAKARGVRLGRPATHACTIADVQRAKARGLVSGQLPENLECRHRLFL